ncbi:hypothetical protein KUCAC02_027495, partial [Chaenocephalus aceratus]
MGKGGEEIAGWTLRVSNYFYCPHSPSFYAQSGVLGSSKKCSPCPSSPQGDVQVSVTLWGKTCCQQYYAMTVMMHHNPPPTHTCWHGSRLPPATGSTCPLGACRPDRQHQPNPTAVLPDCKPMCNEGPTFDLLDRSRARGLDAEFTKNGAMKSVMLGVAWRGYERRQW